MVTSNFRTTTLTYDSSVDVSGYTLYFPTSTIDNGDGTTSTSYTLYPTLSNGTNTITYDETSFEKTAICGAQFKLNGLAQPICYFRFVIGGDYATEHSSTSYNLYNLMLGPTHSATTSLFQWPIRLSIINGPTTKEFFNTYGTASSIRGSNFRHAIRYMDDIGRHILYIYYPSNKPNQIWTSYDNGMYIPIISELYSA